MTRREPSESVNESIHALAREEVATRKQVHTFETLADMGFIGLVATELPEFIGSERGKKAPWRLPLFLASSLSIVVGAVSGWKKQAKADKLREAWVELEYNRPEHTSWREKIDAEPKHASHAK